MGKLPDWILRLIVEQLARFITPELVAAIKAKALEYLAEWGQKLPAGLGEIVVAIAHAVLSNDHHAAAKALVCWANGQALNTVNKIDDAFVDVLAGALGVDKSTCPVPVPTP